LLAALGATGALVGLGSDGTASPPVARPVGASGRPLRFVAVYTPHGRAHELWQPRKGFDIAYSDAILRPFDDPATHGKTFKDRILVLDGVDLSAGIAVGTTGHDGSRAILTGSGSGAVRLGTLPFLVGDLAKLVIAVLLLRPTLRPVRARL